MLQPVLGAALDVRARRKRLFLGCTDVVSSQLRPTSAYTNTSATSFATKFVHLSTNKVRAAVDVVAWTPDGRRLLAGSQIGEFTLWNGTSFNFETILQAHDMAVRALCWSHNENWLISGDDGGSIKYWQPNMNNVKVTQGHKESVRGLSFACTDLKFCSCSDDTTVRVWDFARCAQEHVLTGHGGDVKAVDWHPQKALLASASKDTLVKLWDAKNGVCVASLHGHKNWVTSARWNANGNWLLTASKDQTCKLFDLRMLREMATFHGHNRDVTAIAWHPFHEGLFCSGGYDGGILYWVFGQEGPQAEVRGGHEGAVWSLAWHPMGHILCSGSNDNTTKFWCRNRPGELPRDTMRTAFGAFAEASTKTLALPAPPSAQPPPPLLLTAGMGRAIPGIGGVPPPIPPPAPPPGLPPGLRR